MKDPRFPFIWGDFGAGGGGGDGSWIGRVLMFVIGVLFFVGIYYVIVTWIEP